MAVWRKQRCVVAVIPMKHFADLPVDCLVGGSLSSLQCIPLQPYANESVSFLEDWSRELLGDSKVREYPDVTSFAYWCRPANLARLKRELSDQHSRIGRGLALHIAPTNVPVNFAFSWAFGILSGNANIVRVPEGLPIQASLLCSSAAKVLALPKHDRIATMSRLISYPREDSITRSLSLLADVRVLWGGDNTINHLRAMPVSPRNVDIAFTDRYSLCLIGAKSLLEADENALKALAKGFYNDVFLFDQNACSSPHLLLWQGQIDEVTAAKERFWKAVNSLLNSKEPLSSIHAVEKYTLLCRSAIGIEGVRLERQINNKIYRLSLSELPADIANFRGQYGFFFESIDNDFSQLQRIVNERYQTLSFFGVDPKTLIDTIVSRGLPGIDRVVPIGKALDIGVVWDGYDLIRSMSRIVANR